MSEPTSTAIKRTPYDVRNCAEHISRALSAEMCKRPDADGLAWIENERRGVVEAANAWVEATGVGSTITADDVLAVEGQAVGHFDYQRKLCLYVAEVVLLGNGRSTDV